MSRINETYNSLERICPYCGKSCQPESEEYSEDRRVEECEHCEKKYYAEDVFNVDFKAIPDCELNGEPHDWKDEELQHRRKYPFCKRCGKCKPKER